MEENTRENKMGTMPIGKLLANMAGPVMISMLFQALYNIVDSVFVARLSQDAMNAVSLAFPLQTLCIAFAVGTGVGMNALLARSLGEKNMQAVDRAAGTGLFLTLCTAAVFAVLGFSLATPFFRFQTENAQIIAYGRDYVMICIGGSLGLFLQIYGERLLQSTGRTDLSMISQIAGAVCNIVLDPIFIFGLNMGVRGAALATVISQGVSCAWVVSFLMGKKTSLRLKAQNMRIDMKLLAPCIALGLSAFIMQSTESIISVCFNSSLLKYGGDIAVGAMTIITSATQLLSMPVQGLCQGAQPIMSFNFGAGKGDRVKQAFRLQFIICVAYAAAFWAACMLVPQMFASIFSTDPELVRYTAWAMRVYMAGIFSTGFQVSCQKSFVALGQAKISLFMACLRKLILLIPLIFILPLILQDKVFAVFLAEPVSDIIAATVTCSAFFIRFNKILATSQKKA